MTVYGEVMGGGGLNLDCVESQTWPAKIELGSATIKLACGADASSTMGIILFELMNATTTDNFIDIHIEALTGALSRNEFVDKMERVEFENLKRHHELVTACSFAPGVDLFGPAITVWNADAVPFDAFLATQIANGHTQNYIDHWNLSYRTFWCTSNGPHIHCP